jgi:hypothetical protein
VIAHSHPDPSPSCHEPRCDRPRGHRGDHHACFGDGNNGITHEFWPALPPMPDPTCARCNGPLPNGIFPIGPPSTVPEPTWCSVECCAAWCAVDPERRGSVVAVSDLTPERLGELLAGSGLALEGVGPVEPS